MAGDVEEANLGVHLPNERPRVKRELIARGNIAAPQFSQYFKCTRTRTPTDPATEPSTTQATSAAHYAVRRHTAAASSCHVFPLNSKFTCSCHRPTNTWKPPPQNMLQCRFAFRQLDHSRLRLHVNSSQIFWVNYFGQHN